MSRITNNMIINNFMSNYNKNMKNINKYIEQLSDPDGRRFSNISDDPIDAVKAMKLETTIKFNQKYEENAKEGISWLKVTDEALNDVVVTLRKIRDIAVRAATGSMSTEDRQKYKSEVDQMKEHLVEIANSKYGDSYIFNGIKTKVKPYQNDDTSTTAADYWANGAVSTGKLPREVGAGTTVDVNVTGAEMGFGQMFANLQSFSDALGSGNSAGIQTSLNNMDTHIESILGTRAQVGSCQKRLELTVSRLSAQEIEYTDILSKTADTDVAETIMKWKSQENIYRIALATGASIIQPSLIDFLK